MKSLRTIDSHTGGEPTRVLLSGQLELEGATISELRDDFRNRFDRVRRGLILEPRGSDVLVGAVLLSPFEPKSSIGTVFFNEVGYLGMCGHGAIGVVETLHHLGEIEEGCPTRIDTPAGTVSAFRHGDGWVSIENVLSYPTQLDVVLDVPGLGEVVGDIAYGGNWFFIVRSPLFDVCLRQREQLGKTCWAIRRFLANAGLTGLHGEEIDHVELFGMDHPDGTDSINYVQCPGGAYDRSPCGTGTSAKLSTLYARGELEQGKEYRQASVTGSVFIGSVCPTEGGVIPSIKGRAFVTGESTMLFDDADPFTWGVFGG